MKVYVLCHVMMEIIDFSFQFNIRIIVKVWCIIKNNPNTLFSSLSINGNKHDLVENNGFQWWLFSILLCPEHTGDTDDYSFWFDQSFYERLGSQNGISNSSGNSGIDLLISSCENKKSNINEIYE